MSLSPKARFYALVNEAIADFLEHGFDNQERLDRWLYRLQFAARDALIPQGKLASALTDSLSRVFKRATTVKALLRRNPGVSEYTLRNVAPKLRAELDRRILSSSNLIKLNRESSIARTLQRFSGWATSIPIGGTDAPKRKQIMATVRKGIAALPYEERRVISDQGHKLVASINDILATEGGAIAGIWHHVAEGPPAYQSRPQHVGRNGKVYLIRDSWAHKKGFVRPANGFTEDITAPAEEINCSCWYEHLFTLRDLPPNMLTLKGRTALQEARMQILGMAVH